MGMISTGLKAEQKEPAKKEKTEFVRKEDNDCQSQVPGEWEGMTSRTAATRSARAPRREGERK